MNQELKLIESAKNGDSQAFRILLEQQYDFIYRVSYKLCGNREGAENTAHDVCVKLAVKINSYDGSAAFQTWLYTVIMNTVRDNYRKEKVKRKNIKSGDLMEIAAEVTYSDMSYTDKMLAKQIYYLALNLPDKLKSAFLMVYMEDLSHSEVGQILGCSEGTVSWRISEAKKKIKSALETKAGKATLRILVITALTLIWSMNR